MSWDLTGQESYDSENLPYPNIHLVMQRGKSSIFGVPWSAAHRQSTRPSRARLASSACQPLTGGLLTLAVGCGSYFTLVLSGWLIDHLRERTMMLASGVIAGAFVLTMITAGGFIGALTLLALMVWARPWPRRPAAKPS